MQSVSSSGPYNLPCNQQVEKQQPEAGNAIDGHMGRVTLPPMALAHQLSRAIACWLRIIHLVVAAGTLYTEQPEYRLARTTRTHVDHVISHCMLPIQISLR